MVQDYGNRLRLLAHGAGAQQPPQDSPPCRCCRCCRWPCVNHAFAWPGGM